MTPRSIIGIACLSLAFLALMPAQAHASTPFQAGRIIDDSVFTNNSSMSIMEIQNFLNSKVPSCDTWGTQPYAGTTRAAYAATRGVSTPFTCLKDYNEGGRTSAQIIYDAAQKYSINPQVLIVLLQKEQGLVTDDWPWTIQYRSATGYGCPDTAPCDSQYYGLTNQLDWAAKMFRAILNDSPTWYTPYELGNNYIQYNPTASCSGSVVNIQNRATQALYNYTPYQPNQATLDAGWSTAPCGAYGNRNFFLYFSSWFGSTYGASYSWSYAGQGVYTDSSKTATANPYSSTLKPGGRYYFVLRAKNTGNATWYKGNTKLGLANPNIAGSIYDATWAGIGRPATIIEDSVAPGAIGTFEFWVNIPQYGVDFSALFIPVQEGITWMNDIGAHLPVRTAGTYSWSYAGQGVYTDNTKSVAVDAYNESLIPGTQYYFVLRAKNTGNATWYKGNTKLGLANPGVSSIYDASWISARRPATLTEEIVTPGSVGTFEFLGTVANTPPGTIERFIPVQEGITWMNDIGMHFPINH